ncbi:MAG: glucose-1-phosphate adenylyltransferase [Dehalococcoidia bacterium]|nr:glucose-1-phosphate adenylyltransferase [Dehalococcoidia bacterium]
MNKVLALILAGGQGDRLSILSEERAKPAVIFAGKYRIIDFTLSNCVNSGISNVGVLTQYRPRSLNDHIGIGRPWNLDRERGGVHLLQPYMGRKASDWYKGTADAVFQNLSFVQEMDAEEVLVLAGDHIYTMRYDGMIADHRLTEADVTIGAIEVPIEEASRFGIISLNDDDAVVGFDEKPARPKSNLASMGIYIFRREALLEALTADAQNKTSSHDFGKDVVAAMMKRYRVYGYRYKGYWRDVGTVDSYFKASMELLQSAPPLDLWGPADTVFTRSSERAPAKFLATSQVSQSLISHGCIVRGAVRRSVLSPGVVVEEGAVVEDSIVFDDTVVQRDAALHRSIVDKEVVVGAGARVGHGDDMTPNQDEPTHLFSGITLVGKRARIPPNETIGRNCKVMPGARESDFPGPSVQSGATVEARTQTSPFRV